MARFSYDRVVKYRIQAETIAPLHIGSSVGSKDEILINPTTNVPFVQASSLAGMLRAYSKTVNGLEQTEEMFGAVIRESVNNPNDMRSRVKVGDGIFEKDTVKLELRPGIKINSKTGTVSSANGGGQKFEMKYIGAGARFSFDVYAFVKTQEQEEAVERALGIFAGDGAQLGSKKSSGAGQVHAAKIGRVRFDMTHEDGRKAWIHEEGITDFEDLRLSSNNASVKYTITISAKSEGAIQVKGIAVNGFGSEAADSENIQNSKGEYIVPGTSVRGSIRSQMEKISEYLKVSSVIEDAFGKMGKEHSESHSGNLIFGDIVIGEAEQNEKNPIRHRIHVDKLTAGVFNGGLFSEKNAAGELKNFTVRVRNVNNPDATTGLLLFALRDMAIHIYNLGNGYANGKGFVNIDKITIRDGENQAVITYDGSNAAMQDPSGIILACMNALKEVRG